MKLLGQFCIYYTMQDIRNEDVERQNERTIFMVFTISVIFISWTMYFLGLAQNQSYVNFTLVIGICSIIPVIFYKLERFERGTQIWLIILAIWVFYRCYEIKSVLNLPLIVIFLIFSAMYTNLKFTTGLLLVTITYIIIMVRLDIFTFEQTQDPETGLYYADVITAFLPQLLFGYLVAYVILKNYLKTIQKQKIQNKILRNTQKQLIDQERLKSIQILGGGIAHDFNNILTSILGNSSLLLMDNKLLAEERKAINEIETAALKARNLTQQLLNFSKNIPSSQNIINIRSIFSDVVSYSLSGSKCLAVENIDKDLWNIYGDESKISQAIQNLIINADHAMPNGGKINIIAENLIVHENENFKEEPKKFIRIIIEDQGIGIEKENLGKIFDPFFTTKTQGIGLGLAVSFSVIKEHHGNISVESEVGVGTRFIIDLPATDRKIEDKVVITDLTTNLTGNLWVLEDDPSIRDFVRLICVKVGLDAKFFIDGRNLIDALKKKGECNIRFDYVLLDLTIPGGMGGLDIIED